MENLLKYEMKVKLVPSYFDLNDKLTPKSILCLFQDVASVHGEMIGVGFQDMLKKSLLWVITRVKFDVLSMPKPYQDVIVSTWPHPKGKIDIIRDYEVKDVDGNVLIKGTSQWCVLSLETRRLAPIALVEYPSNSIFCENYNYEEKFTKTEMIKESDSPVFEHEVAYHEIDHNKHLNNVNYATLVLDAISDDNFSHIQINFISECKYKEKIKIYKEEKDDEILVAGYVGGTLKFTALVK